MVKITEEKKEEEPEFIFKDELTALDMYNGFNKENREKMLDAVRMIATTLKKPKLTVKQIFDLPYGKFIKLIKAFKAKEYISKEDFLESREILTDSNDV